MTMIGSLSGVLDYGHMNFLQEIDYVKTGVLWFNSDIVYHSFI